ncbi:MAG: arylamine N-acetyltransferase [Acidocella sp.]|nr:arylamine N-acetyltransferase [Acidocella sp.]
MRDKEMVVPEYFRLQQYLERIGLRGALNPDLAIPDLATLARLHAAHVDAIPFEGLDPFCGRPVRLDLGAIQDKLVDGRRGGYCFEQNHLFKAALDEIGFAVTSLAGRVRWMSAPDAPLGPRTHMLLKVDLQEGSYLADVGFGARVLDAPLLIKPDMDQRTAMGTYRLQEQGNLLALSARQASGWRTMYVFNFEPQIRADYEIANYFTATNPLAPFSNNLIIERVAADRRYKIANRRFVIEDAAGNISTEREIENTEDLAMLFEDIFNIQAPVPVAEIFARIAPV